MTESWLERAAVVAGGVAFLVVYLRSLAFGRPTFGRLARAALRAIVVPAAVLIGAPVFGVAPSAGAVLVAGLFGLVLAIGPLRGDVRAVAPAPRRGDLVAGLAVLGAVAAAAGERQVRLQRTALDEEGAAQVLAPADAFEALEPRTLDLGAGVVAPGPWRSAAVALTATLAPEAILQVRLRAPNVGWPFGVSFFLSNDPRFESGFFEETTVRFRRLGEPAGVAEPGRPLAVVVEAAGRDFVASIDGVEVARATTRRYAAGATVVVAARGAVDVEGVRVTPVSLDEAPVTATTDFTVGAARAAAAVLLLALLSALLLRVAPVRSLAPAACAAAPYALFLRTSDPGAPLDAVGLATHLFAACVLALRFPLVHRDRLTGPRYAVFLVGVGVAAFAAFEQARERAWPAGFEEENALSVVDWDGARQEPDLIHLTHPALRRWNNYLADHTLRLLRHDRARPAGKARVVAIGTSSTHGYWLKLPYAYRLHLLLEAEGHPVETLIAAVPGATGPRLHWFARNVVMEYRPDVVTLSQTFNDAYALTQLDEGAYLERITAPGYERSLLDRVRDRLAVVLGGRYLRSCLDEFAATGGVERREGAPDPPARFEAMLDGFAELCAAHGAALVLVKEPIAGGTDRLWKDEFYAAIDRVGARHGLRVVDPTPLLNERGGADLFMDRVHPLAEGAQVIAEAMRPAVEAALTERRE
ncbi:MAG: SGNH/GDSL hydrolase family protein [Planctomycetota bacterium JB042]